MNENRKKKFEQFLDYFNRHIKGHEKSEGQIFFDRLLQAFGNKGVKEVGATCEELVQKKKNKKGFIDFTWNPRVIIELKKRGENLQKHYDQAFDYWVYKVPRTKYMVLCNFDEFWIYDLNQQLFDPVCKLKIKDLPENYGPLNFLFPKEKEPIFDKTNIAVTKEIAQKIGNVYRLIIKRKINEEKAQRFVLQLVVALFSENVDLIPKYTVQKILYKILKQPRTANQKSLEKLLFSMATDKKKSNSSKHQSIPFFNGGLFEKVETIELHRTELDIFYEASQQDWKKIRPSVFGSLFEQSIDQNSRHSHGIHYTSEIDIHKIIYPTIIKPFKEQIQNAKPSKLKEILSKIRNFKVLDPACGSGNFLYIAFIELRKLETQLMEQLGESKKRQLRVSPKNFYGIDTNKFALQIAKVALSLGRKLSSDESSFYDPAIPFDDLEKNFFNKDALFENWPKADAIIGNPPFLSSKKMKVQRDPEYVNKVRKYFKDVPGRADYCVYWFRKAHDHLQTGQRAGLVGTNTIRENYSREGGLDYIAQNGTITEAVSSQVWSGEANVHVSIVNWIKGGFQSKKKLWKQLGNKVDSPLQVESVDKINSSLSDKICVKDAKVLRANKNPKRCFTGQIAESGFYLSKEECRYFIKRDKRNAEVIFPFLIGKDLLGKTHTSKRFIIDFGHKPTLLNAKSYKMPFQHIKDKVLPKIQTKAKNELNKNGREGDWNHHLNHWWRHWRNRPELLKVIKKIKKYIAVSRVSTHPLIFDFVSNHIHPGDALNVFPFEDNYSFGILQSRFHLEWFNARCSTFKADPRYTGDTVFPTFPWPQNPTKNQIIKISSIVDEIMEIRSRDMKSNKLGLRELYNTFNLPGKNPLKDSHQKLDEAVRQAYGMPKNQDILSFLLNLNKKLYEKEEKGLKISGTGLPSTFERPKELISKFYIKNTMS